MYIFSLTAIVDWYKVTISFGGHDIFAIPYVQCSCRCLTNERNWMLRFDMFTKLNVECSKTGNWVHSRGTDITCLTSRSLRLTSKS